MNNGLRLNTILLLFYTVFLVHIQGVRDGRAPVGFRQTIAIDFLVTSNIVDIDLRLKTRCFVSVFKGPNWMSIIKYFRSLCHVGCS